MLHVLALAAVAVVGAGCGTDPSKTLRELASWAATTAMVGQAWADGATPRAYTTRTLGRVEREMAEQRRELGTLPAPQRLAATPIAERVEQSTRTMTAAVRAGDRSAARRLARALTADARTLRQLADRNGPS